METLRIEEKKCLARPCRNGSVSSRLAGKSPPTYRDLTIFYKPDSLAGDQESPGDPGLGMRYKT